MFSHFVFILCVHSVTPCGFLFCVLLLLFIFFFIYFIISLRIKCITYSVHNVYVMMLMFSEIVAATRAFARYAENMIVSCARYKLSRLQLSLGALKPNVSRLLRLSSLVDRARARAFTCRHNKRHTLTYCDWLRDLSAKSVGKFLLLAWPSANPIGNCGGNSGDRNSQHWLTTNYETVDDHSYENIYGFPYLNLWSMIIVTNRFSCFCFYFSLRTCARHMHTQRTSRYRWERIGESWRRTHSHAIWRAISEILSSLASCWFFLLHVLFVFSILLLRNMGTYLCHLNNNNHIYNQWMCLSMVRISSAIGSISTWY